jgi:methyl coenzyme M reductase subunit C-like uncharacterized protein (methanogenesis marker protein 7)
VALKATTKRSLYLYRVRGVCKRSILNDLNDLQGQYVLSENKMQNKIETPLQVPQVLEDYFVKSLSSGIFAKQNCSMISRGGLQNNSRRS